MNEIILQSDTQNQIIKILATFHQLASPNVARPYFQTSMLDVLMRQHKRTITRHLRELERMGLVEHTQVYWRKNTKANAWRLSVAGWGVYQPIPF